MAQAEDTELRDLVIEALEKNGSLAKIRALLRANVFLAFEEECENVKHNVSLDSILKLPEGILCLSIIHEFLEFCNLKNTLFVYMAESRQRKEYDYEGQAQLAEKLNLSKKDNLKEPILVTILKNVLKSSQRKYMQQSEIHNHKSHEKCDNNYKDEQNCTYIVHEDSSASATSNSQSDNSDSEKNKLHLRLQLDNSDTDTSSDSAREKSASEYIPSEHLGCQDDIRSVGKNETGPQYFTSETQKETNLLNYSCNQGITNNTLRELQLLHNSSSDSTSYVELKPYNALDKKLLNTTGIPVEEVDEIIDAKNNMQSTISSTKVEQQSLKSNSTSSSTSLNSGSSMSIKKDPEIEKESQLNQTHSIISGKSETAEYSNDFTSSPTNKDIVEVEVQSPQSATKTSSKNSDFDNQHSASSQSSVSISDVADLLSERSSFAHKINNRSNLSENMSKSNSEHSKNKSSNEQNRLSDDSVDFSESLVPSLSNLSLDIHSE